jgi:CO/xanthine dehydrogenase Mo-binding subunit
MLVEDGRVTSLSLGDYKIPTIRDLPTRKTTLVAGAIEGPGPFNAKPAAKHAITPIPPANGNAVFNATGVRLTSLPISCGKFIEQKSSAEISGRPNKFIQTNISTKPMGIRVARA